MLLLPIFLFLSIKVSAIVQDLDCNGINNTFTLNGTNVTFTCEVQTSSIVWDIQPLDNQIGFSAVNDPGDNIITDGFTAIYVQETPPGISTLNFILDLSLNETRVTCLDSGLPGNQITCSILVINVPDLPEGVTNISCTYSSVEIQWSSPSFNGGSDIIRYHITVEPPPSRIDTSCSGGECSTTDSNTLTYNITGLDYNQTYCLTVSAENIAGNSSVSELCVFVTANVPPAINTSPSLCLNYDGELVLEVFWSSAMNSDVKTPPTTSYTVCINENCSGVVSDCLTNSVKIIFDEEYNVSIKSKNIVGFSDSSPQAVVDTYLLTSITERDITNDSALISYTTFSGCSDFPDLEVELSISGCNATMMKMTIRNDYATNRNDETFKLSSLIPECVYDYTIQVFNGNAPLGMSVTGIFTTLSNDDANVDDDDDDGGGGGGGDSSVIECMTTRVIPEVTSTCTCVPESKDLSTSATVGITVAVTIPVTSIVTSLFTLLVVYVFCMKHKRSYSPSATNQSVVYDTPLPVSNITGTSKFEMKSNLAYGHVTTSPSSTPQDYEIMTS